MLKWVSVSFRLLLEAYLTPSEPLGCTQVAVQVPEVCLNRVHPAYIGCWMLQWVSVPFAVPFR
jgi:hypothetical protein